MGRKGASVGHGYNDKEGENCFAHRQSFERAVDRLIAEPWFGAFFSIARLSLSAQTALRTVATSQVGTCYVVRPAVHVRC